jgi:hypothetical protein
VYDRAAAKFSQEADMHSTVELISQSECGCGKPTGFSLYVVDEHNNYAYVRLCTTCSYVELDIELRHAQAASHLISLAVKAVESGDYV